MNTTSVMTHLETMHAFGLYSSVELLSSLMLSMSKNCHDIGYNGMQCEILMYSADSLFENKEYQKAEITYTKALQQYKLLPKSKQKHTLVVENQVVSDVDIKYKIYQCCCLLQNDSGALSILESIPQKQRNVKIHLCMAKVYQKLRHEKQAIVCYKEVLRSCPLALDCAIQLLHLGEHPNVVISMMNTDCHVDWLVPFVKAHGCMLTKDISKSTSLFDGLTKRASLKGNAELLCNLATTCYFAGNSAAALQHFKAAYMQDPQRVKGMDLYAYLLCEDEENEELEKLSTSLFAVSQLHPQPWVAMGYYAKSKGDFTKAIYLAARASELDATCVQALLLKGVSLCKLEEVKTAVTHFRQAMLFNPNRLDCYAELVYCLMKEERNNEAVNIAKSAIDNFGYTPDALVLCAWALHSDSSSHEQAIRLADRALKINPDHKRAIEIRCIIAKKQKKHTDAIEVLKLAVQRNGSSVFHSMLADCYVRVGKFADAVDHYNMALSINPNNADAKAGLDKLDGIPPGNTFEGDQEEELASNEQGERNRMTGVAWPQEDWF